MRASHPAQRQTEGLRGHMHAQDAALGRRVRSCGLLVTLAPKLACMKPSWAGQTLRHVSVKAL